MVILMPSISLAITALLEQRHGRLPAYSLETRSSSVHP
jgi:hypothetical protein